MAILEVKGINKKFGNKQVLHDVTFNVEEGEIVGLIGPNGAGKTTTIKLILGLQSIDSGEIIINGYNLKKDFEEAIKCVGSIVENPDAYMFLSGYDNLKLIANLYPNVKDEDINRIVKLVKLENRYKDKVSKYSLGMRERLGIASALLSHPKLLILDEPTNGLDPEGIKELRDILKNLAKKENVAILISSHNLSELETICTDACIIQNGRVIEKKPIKVLKKGNTSKYLIELDNTGNLDIDCTILNDHEIIVSAEKKDIPLIIEKLIKNKKKIYLIKEQEVSLEDAFIKLVGGNTID